mmetsp:Transcript_2837/g.6555  ORF Transcript_2837/g.6555 Transcript_2837/m.6555 type:complete len:230 (-) Transcript_2837:1519-2208(-)
MDRASGCVTAARTACFGSAHSHDQLGECEDGPDGACCLLWGRDPWSGGDAEPQPASACDSGVSILQRSPAASHARHVRYGLSRHHRHLCDLRLQRVRAHLRVSPLHPHHACVLRDLWDAVDVRYTGQVHRGLREEAQLRCHHQPGQDAATEGPARDRKRSGLRGQRRGGSGERWWLGFGRRLCGWGQGQSGEDGGDRCVDGAKGGYYQGIPRGPDARGWSGGAGQLECG